MNFNPTYYNGCYILKMIGAAKQPLYLVSIGVLGLPGGRNGQMDTPQLRDENDWLRVFRGDIASWYYMNVLALQILQSIR